MADHGSGHLLKIAGADFNNDENDYSKPIEHVMDSRTGKSPGYRFMDHVAVEIKGHSKNA